MRHLRTEKRKEIDRVKNLKRLARVYNQKVFSLDLSYAHLLAWRYDESIQPTSSRGNLAAPFQRQPQRNNQVEDRLQTIEHDIESKERAALGSLE